MEALPESIQLRRRLWELWGNVDKKVKEKFNNLCSKTGRYSVPEKLFQKRTSRSNRVLLPWKTYVHNQMNWNQLQTFYGGVCVEFVNNDFFNDEYEDHPDYNRLKNLLGSDELISSMLSFRTEDGDSGATIPRQSYQLFEERQRSGQLIGNFEPIIRNELVEYTGRGDNSVWKGNLYFYVKGGAQDGYDSHQNIKEQKLFNPAIEYANPRVIEDINITMSYFAMYCHDLNHDLIDDFAQLKIDVENYLRTRNYDEGNLFQYCTEHTSLRLDKGKLMDPIQVIPMSIYDFATSGTEESSVNCHNEAANKEVFHYDCTQNCILSPARPTNFFWSTHLSNMMQQNSTLDEFIQDEERRYKKRNSLL